MDHEVGDRDEALKQLKLHLLKTQEQMKRTANAHRRDVTFDIGDWVYLKLQPHMQQSMAQRINQKITPRYYGPFQIEKFGLVAYQLKLPTSSNIPLS